MENLLDEKEELFTGGIFSRIVFCFPKFMENKNHELLARMRSSVPGIKFFAGLPPVSSLGMFKSDGTHSLLLIDVRKSRQKTVKI